MHIPDGYLGPVTYISLFLIMIPVWFLASRNVNKNLSTKRIPFLAFAIAFAFLIQMFNIPAPGGTTGHAVGGVIVAIIAGPSAAIIGVSSVLVIQALLFGDGGITALGANSFNMAFIMPVAGYYIYRLLSVKADPKSARNWVAAAIAGYIAINLVAIAVAIQLGIQPILHSSPEGQPYYSPYPLSVTIPIMAFEHLAIFGFIEAAATGLVVTYLAKIDPNIISTSIQNATIPQQSSPMASKSVSRKLIIFLLAVAILTPLGLLATGTPFGEGGPESILDELSYIPEGLQDLSGIWSTPFSDYSIPGFEIGLLGSFGYIVSAIAGVILSGGIIYLARLNRQQNRAPKSE
jgi:cobalt/nickel transport system permease protein